MAATQTGSSSKQSGKRSKANGRSSSGRKVNVFHQRLGSLTFHQATALLGDDGARLMRQGNRFTEINPDDVFLGGDLLRVKMFDVGKGFAAKMKLRRPSMLK